jgi:pyruvate dehydrogenase E1 component alpha subunit
MSCKTKYNIDFIESDPNQVLFKIKKEGAVAALRQMDLIRQFELRGEQSYQKGNVWGFYHSYIGQEAIQTAAVTALGADKHLWATTYRCHALALLLGATANECMAELFGKVTGNAKGRGGSMHFYTDRMFGGSGIVGGQWPLGAGLAFSLKYKGISDEVSLCFGGDGSVMQGTFHESMNLASLWKLPLIMVVENNQIGMGTQLSRAVANLPIGKNLASAYGAHSINIDGMDFYSCYEGFTQAYQYIIKEKKPVIIEAVCDRFKGHSISDAAEYRTKEELDEAKKRDPIELFYKSLEAQKFCDQDELLKIKSENKRVVLDAVKFAEESPFPNVNDLEEGVLADS